mgnify:CR=1 FL=1
MTQDIQIRELEGMAITDEYGYTFQGCIAEIFNASETTQRMLKGNRETGNYDIDGDIQAVAYEVNYYYNEDLKNAGVRGRPLAVDSDKGGFTCVLEVNLKLASVANILSSPLPHDEKILQAAQADLEARSV